MFQVTPLTAETINVQDFTVLQAYNPELRMYPTEQLVSTFYSQIGNEQVYFANIAIIVGFFLNEASNK